MSKSPLLSTDQVALLRSEMEKWQGTVVDAPKLILRCVATIEAHAEVVQRVKDGWRLSNGAVENGIPPFWYREDCEDPWYDHVLTSEQQLVVYGEVLASPGARP